jgi:hypothetical protein
MAEMMNAMAETKVMSEPTKAELQGTALMLNAMAEVQVVAETIKAEPQGMAELPATPMAIPKGRGYHLPLALEGVVVGEVLG